MAKGRRNTNKPPQRLKNLYVETEDRIKAQELGVTDADDLEKRVKKTDSPETKAWKKRVQKRNYEATKRFGGTREQYTTLAAYYLEDQWQANPDNPSPMKGFKERFGTFENTVAGETRQMQPKTTSSYNPSKQGGPKVAGESPKGVQLVNADTVDSFSETRRFNESIPVEIEVQIKAMELNGSWQDGSPLPPNFSWEDFQKKISSGKTDLKKIQKVLKSQGIKIDLGHWLPIGAPEIDNAARHRGEGPPDVGTSLRHEDQTANRGGGARSHKDPKYSALAAMGVPRTWKEVLANYAMPEGVPDAKAMFGNLREMEGFAQWSRGKTDVEINKYIQSLESSNLTDLRKYDKVSGLEVSPGRDPATLPKAPDLPPAKFLKNQKVARNTMRAAKLMNRMDKRERIFNAIDDLARGDYVRAVGSLASLTPVGARLNLAGEAVNMVTQATTGMSIGDRLKMTPEQLQIEHQINQYKNLKSNRGRQQLLRRLLNSRSKFLQQSTGSEIKKQNWLNTSDAQAVKNVRERLKSEGAVFADELPDQPVKQKPKNFVSAAAAEVPTMPRSGAHRQYGYNVRSR